ncbi:MAG: nucleotide exchange factor GrpE, partial [SAR324 cluster bacterium]|nr:nucleotide exchange factor GrpE [SAR324 cluster bacterium]
AADAESKYKDMQDRYLRLNAEFDNYKKRMMRENSDRLKYFNMELIKELLPSVDNLERAISHAGEDHSDLENMIEGLQMVYKGMQEAFGKFGVSEIESIGKEFDPNCHQAVGMIESQEVPENHVAEECLKGYYLHDRIIRPTMVRVSGKG